jgi:hypothetical protein
MTMTTISKIPNNSHSDKAAGKEVTDEDEGLSM